MAAMILPGVIVTLLGVALLIWCVASVTRARRGGLDDEAMKAHLQRAVVWNMLAVCLSGIGLALVVVGLLLG